MNFTTSAIGLRRAFAFAGSLALAGAAQAATTYTTTFYGTDDNTFSVSRIEMLWTTSIAANEAVTVSDLSDLSILVYDESDALVFTDHAIVGGVAQPIGGITRQLGDLGFDAISGVSISSFDNATNPSLLNGSTGTTFNIYGPFAPFSDLIVFSRYESGVFTGPDTDFTVTSQVTTSPIPEPSAFAALAGLGALGLAAARRRARA